jgi:hypothetical protein
MQIPERRSHSPFIRRSKDPLLLAERTGVRKSVPAFIYFSYTLESGAESGGNSTSASWKNSKANARSTPILIDTGCPLS